MGAIEHVVTDGQIHNHSSLPEQESRPPITRNPERMSGAPTIAGARLPVITLIDYLSDGHTVAEFLDDFEGAVTIDANPFGYRDTTSIGQISQPTSGLNHAEAGLD